MASIWRRRRCRFCRRWYEPDVRVGERQLACDAEPCRRARKKAAQAAWLARDPGYFRGRAEKHRQWRRKHPDAQRQRRKRDPAVRERERVAQAKRRGEAASRRVVEQDARALQLVCRKGDEGCQGGVGEQDAMRAQLCVLIGVASRLPPVGEQGPIAGALRTWHDRGRRVVGGTHATARTP